MKANIFYILIFCCMSFICRSQNIYGEINPCPEIPYSYTFNGSASSGTISFSVVDGRIVSSGPGSITVIWNNTVLNGGRWAVNVNYYDPIINKNMQEGLKINLKATTSFTISGDKEIEYGFRGIKTYNALPTSAGYPASSYNWQTNTGINIITSQPTISINFTDDNINQIVVRGKNSNCDSWGPETFLMIKRLIKITGSSTICNSEEYSFSYPGTITLINANNIATLTKISNTKYKVSRIGEANGSIILQAENNGISTTKTIYVGSKPVIITGNNSLKSGESYEFLLDGEATGITWKISGDLTFIDYYAPNGSFFYITASMMPHNFPAKHVAITATYTNSCGKQQSITKELTINP